MLDLKKIHKKQARRWRREAARKLLQGKGFDGRFLKGKKFPNGRPLGFGKTAAGVPGRVRRASITTFLSGFDVTLATRLKDEVFHTGSRKQVPRPYVGFSQKQIDANLKELARAIRKEGRRLKVFR